MSKKSNEKADETEKIFSMISRSFKKEIRSKTLVKNKVIRARLRDELSHIKETSERLIHGKA